MAYLHHSFKPPVYSARHDLSALGKGQVDILNILDRLRADEALKTFMSNRAEEIRQV